MQKKHLSPHSLALLTLLVLLLPLSSCHKNCVCTTRTGGEVSYSEDDLDKVGVSCTRRADHPVEGYYVKCSWE